MNPRQFSLRQRLVLGSLVIGLVFATLFGSLATWLVHRAEAQAITSALHNRMELARDQVRPDGTINEDSPNPRADLIQVLAPDGSVLAHTSALRGYPALAELRAVATSSTEVQTRFTRRQPDVDLAVLAEPRRVSVNGRASAGALVVATNAEGFSTATAELFWLLVLGLVTVVLATAVLAWGVAGRALRSVTRVTESAEAVRPRDLASGLPVPHGDAEMTRLVQALNRMLTRLHESHATELAFAADAGHRLRTPVATLRAEAELGLHETDPEELTATLRRVVADADQLTSIVDRMLARSRAGHDQRAPAVPLLDAAATRWHRQASLASVRLVVEVEQAIPGDLRSTGLEEILDPVLDNAIRHTPAHGAVHVGAQLDGEPGGDLVVSVSNTGEPIDPEMAARMFDAWVSSRDASVAGGLGLWLARETARDLGGDLTLVDDGPHTTTLRLRLPTEGGPHPDGQATASPAVSRPGR